MPNADFSSWTPLQFLAESFYKWSSSELNDRPKNGSLLQIITSNGETTLTPTQA